MNEALLSTAPVLLDTLTPLQQALDTYSPLFDVALSPENATLLSQFSGLVANKLAIVESVDPAAAAALDGSMAQLLTGLGDALHFNLQQQAQQQTTGLVLGLQQMVTALKFNSSGITVHGMAAAQEALAATAVVSPAARCRSTLSSSHSSTTAWDGSFRIGASLSWSSGGLDQFSAP